jgi:hypothetical protein
MAKGIREAIMSEIKKSLVTDVLKTIQTREKRSIAKVVYRAYSPETYIRRYTDGGLIDDRNIEGIIEKEDGNSARLSISNLTKYNTSGRGYGGSSSEYLTPLIVLGQDAHPTGYSWFPNPKLRSRGYAKERNFIGDTVNELRKSNAHVDALRKSLKSKGIEVK